MNLTEIVNADIDDDLVPYVRRFAGVDFDDPEDTISIGTEHEFGTVDDQYNLGTHDDRKPLLEPEWTEVELGQNMVEIRTDPFHPSDLSEIAGTVEDRRSELQEIATNNDLKLVKTGTNPWAGFDLPLTEFKKRYDVLTTDARNSELVEMRKPFGTFGSIDPESWKLPGMINAFQLNIQANTEFSNYDDPMETTVEWINRLQAYQPTLMAAVGNSGILDKTYTGWRAPRTKLWEMNYNTKGKEDRVGAINGYLEGRIDMLERRHTTYKAENSEDIDDLDKKRFQNAEGENWKDVRAKIDAEAEHILIEARMPPTQPESELEAGISGALLGRVGYSIKHDEELPPFYKVMENREEALEHGMDANLWYRDEAGRMTRGSARKALDSYMRKASEGLEWMGIQENGNYLDDLLEIPDFGFEFAKDVAGFNSDPDPGEYDEFRRRYANKVAETQEHELDQKLEKNVPVA